MAWVKQRITDTGAKRFVACYRDPDGRQRSAGTYSSRRTAERAGQREEVKFQDGSWHDHTRGEVTFTDYVQTVWLPSRHTEASTLAAYQAFLKKHFYPFLGAKQMGIILPSRHPTVGHHRDCEWSLTAECAEVPHDAALGVQAGGPESGDHLQPV